MTFSRLRSALLVGVLFALPKAADGQMAGSDTTAARSAPISDVRYEVIADQAHVLRRTLGVRMRFTTPGNAPVLLSIPAWTPGDYSVANFARNVVDFAATGGGRALGWDKLDYDTWRIRPAGAREIDVSFLVVADALDNSASWTAADFAFFNGTTLFPYAEGFTLEFPSTVTITTEPQWLVATGMTAAAGSSGGATRRPAGAAPARRDGAPTARTFTASNYHELVDMPTFVGRFDLDSARIADVWFRLASYPAGFLTGADRRTVWDVFRKLIPPQVAIYGDVPFESYTVLQVADSSYGGISGLEHQNSHLNILTPFAKVHPLMFSIYSHEFVHAWNVKRLRPADLWPYRYDHPQPTEWLWVSEGITDYQGDLAMVRGGVWQPAEFHESIAQKINNVAGVPAVALEDASLSAWIKPVDGTASIYYDKGSLAGLLLDVLIRDATNGERSLDDAMRELYRATYKQGRGFTAGDFWAAVTRAAGGKSFTDFRDRYVDGRDPYPYTEVLALAGLRAAADTIREPRLGVTTIVDTGGIRVVGLERGGAADAAGLQEGDYLLAVGDIAVQDQEFGVKFRARFGNAEGSPLPLRVRREGVERTLTGRVRLGTRVEWRVSADPAASVKAARIRSGLLGLK